MRLLLFIRTGIYKKNHRYKERKIKNRLKNGAE